MKRIIFPGKLAALKKAAFFLFPAVLFLCGCSTIYNPATGRNEFILVDSAMEKDLGKSVVPEVLRETPLSRDSFLQDRVKMIGAKLAQVSDRQDIEYQFAVLDNKELNAFTIPGGYVYIYEGLARELNDNELAYVLGHEVGHVAARHIAKKIQANMGYQLIFAVALTAAGDRVGPNTQTIAQGVDTVYRIAVDLPFSRADEYQADSIGVKYSLKAGYDPWAAITALEKIKKTEGLDWKTLGYLRTHPFPDQRIAALKEQIPKHYNK